MGYVTASYYSTVYQGEPIDISDFNRYEARASEVIDQITRYRIAHVGLSSFPEYIQQLIKSAECAQLEYYAEAGIETAQTGLDPGTFTVGKVSVGGRSSTTSSTAAAARASAISPAAIALLEQTGLLNPAVGVWDV